MIEKEINFSAIILAAGKGERYGKKATHKA